MYGLLELGQSVTVKQQQLLSHSADRCMELGQSVTVKQQQSISCSAERCTELGRFVTVKQQLLSLTLLRDAQNWADLLQWNNNYYLSLCWEMHRVGLVCYSETTIIISLCWEMHRVGLVYYSESTSIYYSAERCMELGQSVTVNLKPGHRLQIGLGSVSVGKHQKTNPNWFKKVKSKQFSFNSQCYQHRDGGYFCVGKIMKEGKGLIKVCAQQWILEQQKATWYK